MDPPREGFREGIGSLKKLRPNYVLYISCHLPALRRDLGHLLQTYQVDWVQAFDFFPQTPNLETVVMCRLAD